MSSNSNTEPVIAREPLQQIDRTYVLWRGQRLSYFSGCDYFRLSGHPKVIAAISTGLKRYGLNVAASRKTTGEHVLYQRLEQRLARLFCTEAALLVSSGYVANLAVAQALAGQFSHALIDESSHPSLMDATKALDCPVVKFKHRSAVDLASVVRRCGPGSKLILLTDGVFARDGAIAPLQEYLKIIQGDAVMLVDDAHGAGVLGAHGRGSVEQAGVDPRRITQTITLSKALGVYGGAVLSSASLKKKIVERSHLFAGSTPLPLPLANAALESVKILGTTKALRTRLARNSLYVKNALRKAGLPIAETPGPIIALNPRTAVGTAKMNRALLAAHVYPPFIRYPGGPDCEYFRFVISSEHSRDQLDNLIAVLTRAAALFYPDAASK